MTLSEIETKYGRGLNVQIQKPGWGYNLFFSYIQQLDG